MCLLISLLAAFAPGFSIVFADDSSSEAWPEQVYTPQRAEDPGNNASMQPGKPAPTASGQFADGAPGVTPEGKKHWHFKHKKTTASQDYDKDKGAFHAVPPKPSAQQADPPASPYPLLRLPMPIITDQGIVPPGIYLIKTEISAPKIGSMTYVQKAPKPELDGKKPLLLTRQNEVMASIPIHPATLPDENMEQTGTSSPITPANPKIPPPLKIRVEISADQRSLHLVVTNGNQHYESDEYIIGTDLRHKLTF